MQKKSAGRREAEAVASGRSDNSNEALVELRRLIAAHAQTPGQPLPTERELMLRFGLGRRAVRRALAVLEAEGRIWRRQGKGTFVGPAAPAGVAGPERWSSRTNFFEVMEARLQLEPGLAGLAALRASGEQVAMLRRLCTRLAESGDADGHELWDSAFHRCIAEAAGNRLMLELFEAIDAVRRDPAWGPLRDKARNRERLCNYAEQHAEIAEAIAAREAARASDAMRRHIRALQTALQAVGDEELELAA
jgi:DNA-binding FadR family transcriptional regulator